MKKRVMIFVVLPACFITLFFFVTPCTSSAEQSKAPEKIGETKAIDIEAEVSTDHPEYEEGVTCNDCHEMKFDAKTTATEIWLTGESPGRAAGEGVMPKDRLWKEIVKTIGGIKKDSKTYVLGTCMNNIPLTTTAEFTLDPQKKVLYGFHEQGTKKLYHIKANPRVSLNWHVEFETFTDFLCVQILGRAELIDGTNEEFEKIMIDFLPYESGARVPSDATAEQREKRLKQFRDSLKKGFCISKISIDQITIATMDFVKEGFRRYQRWEP